MRSTFASRYFEHVSKINEIHFFADFHCQFFIIEMVFFRNSNPFLGLFGMFDVIPQENALKKMFKMLFLFA